MSPDADNAHASAQRQVRGGLLSIIMPAYNLGTAIADNIRQVHDLFEGRIPFEIVVVDDGSQDETRREVEHMADTLSTVHPVFLANNLGKGDALRNGFHACSGSHILLLDGDLDLPPEQVWGFFAVMERENADVVIGSKRHPDSVLHYPWHRRLVSNVYYGMVKLLIGLPVRDTQTGFKLFKREVLDYVVPRMLVKRFAFDLELLAIAHGRGFKVAEAPITLHFHFGGALQTMGCLRLHTIRNVMTDTLGIFYRLRLLRYYQSIRETRMPDRPPLVSVIIACPAPSPCLDECVEAILNQTYQLLEIILLPDAPSGRTWPDRVREIPTGPLRPAEKRNMGIKDARGEIIAFLDDDTFPAEHWLRHAVVYFFDPRIAAVGGPAVTPGNDAYLARMGGRVYSNLFVSGYYRYRYEPTHVQNVVDFPSCNLLVRKEVLDGLGGFHTEFWPGEDTYLCLEIVRDLRREIVYDPRVFVFHHRRRLFLPHLRQVGRYALHRGYFAKRFPETSRRITYMLPSLFVFGLVAGGVASAFSLYLRALYLSALWTYGLVTFGSCFTRDLGSWLLTWLGVVCTHAVYGVRFAQGLLARRMPGEVRGFDHASEGNP